MAQKTILTMLAITLLLASMFPIISAEIIWSNPVSVGFTIVESPDNPDNPTNPRSCDGNSASEQRQEQLQTAYGEWTCSNNRMQRISVINGEQKTEFEGACGLNIDENPQFSHSNQTSRISDSLIIMPVILIILILIALVLIALRLTQLKSK